MHEGRGCVWYRVAVALVLAPFNLLLRHEWRHAERVPRSGGAIIAANHISHVDPLVLGWFVHRQGRQCHFLAKESLFRVPGLGWLLRSAGQIPVHRGTPDAPLALRSAQQALEEGKAVIIYPEGSITTDPGRWPMAARTGLARLALQTGVPVVPVGQWGAHRLRGGRRRVVLSAGEPVDLTAYRDRPLTPGVLREVTDAVMDAVRREVVAVRGGAPPPVPLDPRPLGAVAAERERRTA